MHRPFARIPIALATLSLLAACGTAPDPASQPAQPTKPPAPISAAKAESARAYATQALDEAKKVAPDAVLVRVDSQRGADFEAHLPVDGKVPHWLYTFASREKRLEISVTVSSLGAKNINQSEISLAPETVLPAGWKDSVDAFATAQKNGGEGYLASRPNLPIYYSLGYDARLKKHVWTIRYSANPKQGLYFLLVDAVSGAFIEKQETKPDTTAT